MIKDIQIFLQNTDDIQKMFHFSQILAATMTYVVVLAQVAGDL